MNLTQWLTRQNTGITSSPCTNKYHLQSDQSDSLIPQYFWGKLLGSVAILKNPESFFSERTTRSCVDEPKFNNQFLTMVTQLKHQFFFFHNMQNKSCTRHIPHIMHEPWQPLQICMNSITWQWPWSFKHMHLIVHFNPGATWLFHPTFFLSLTFNILTEMPVGSSSIDVWHQTIISSIVRFHSKNSSGNTFCHLHITMNSASTK